ncbi:MAG: TIGR00366 family protein [Eudoraea sp.]|uniref:YfcC family protein n=2 Tax=Eudoraea sp. TaxID=1979955 RepID=UPI003C70D731
MRKFPNALVIMISIIFLAAIFTYIIPQGKYERVLSPDTGEMLVVPHSYKSIDAPSVSIAETFMAIPQGIINRADVIALIFLIGGSFFVLEKTGALNNGVEYLVDVLRGKEEVVLVLVSLVFLAGGALSGLQEEIIAMTPVLLFLCHRMGYDSFVAIAISYGSAVLGASFSPINPFAVVIAQKETNLEFLSGSTYRLVVMGLAFVIWMWLVIRYANKNRIVKSAEFSEIKTRLSLKTTAILGIVATTFFVLIIGILQYNWGFNEMSAEFFAMGILIGIIGGLGINGTAEAYIEGFKAVTFATIIIGLSSSISIILEKGFIIDSIIYGLFTPLQYLPKSISAIAMLYSQALLHIVVPSYSGQAILTMPILAPLSDLIGLSRQVCVLAYQYGAVMMDMIIPTNGGLMAVLAIAGIPFNKWFSFIFKLCLTILLFASLAVVVAVYLQF